MLTGVHRGSPPFVTWADCDEWVLADAREPRRMRPHLRPAGSVGRCQQREPYPPACTFQYSYPRQRTSRADAVVRRGTRRHHRRVGDLPAQVSQAPGHAASMAVAHGPPAPSAEYSLLIGAGGPASGERRSAGSGAGRGVPRPPMRAGRFSGPRCGTVRGLSCGRDRRQRDIFAVHGGALPPWGRGMAVAWGDVGRRGAGVRGRAGGGAGGWWRARPGSGRLSIRGGW